MGVIPTRHARLAALLLGQPSRGMGEHQDLERVAGIRATIEAERQRHEEWREALIAERNEILAALEQAGYPGAASPIWPGPSPPSQSRRSLGRRGSREGTKP